MDVLPVDANKSWDKSKDANIQLSPSEAPKDEDFIVASPDQSSSLPNENQSKNSGRGKSKRSMVKKEKISVETVSKKTTEGTKYLDAKKQNKTTKDRAFREEDAFRNDSGSTSDTESRSLDKLKEACIQLSPSEAPKKVYFIVASPYQSGEENRSKRSGWKRRKGISVMKGKISVDTASKKSSEGTKSSEAKKKRSVKKKPVETGKSKAFCEEDASRNDGGIRGDTESRSLNRTGKPDDARNEIDDESPSRNEDIKKSVRVKKSFERDHGKDMVASPRSPFLKSMKGENNREETPRTDTKRKQTSGTDKGQFSKRSCLMSGIGDYMVGIWLIQKWWLDDQMFYEGVIASYDYIKKKHTVLYNDGDEEVLNLRKEWWEFVGDDQALSRGKTVEDASSDAFSDIKSKGTATKSSNNSKDSIKVSEMAKRKMPDNSMSRESGENGGKKQRR